MYRIGGLAAKSNIEHLLFEARKLIVEAKSRNFDLKPVTINDWPRCGIFYGHTKKAWLTEIGAMKNPEDYEFGYFRSNANNSKVNAELNAIIETIDEIWDLLEHYHLRPKVSRHSEIERSRFTLIQCDDESDLLKALKRGVANG